jgi:hypothetical protein
MGNYTIYSLSYLTVLQVHFFFAIMEEFTFSVLQSRDIGGKIHFVLKTNKTAEILTYGIY